MVWLDLVPDGDPLEETTTLFWAPIAMMLIYLGHLNGMVARLAFEKSVLEH
jgi:hypothetical protein